MTVYIHITKSLYLGLFVFSLNFITLHCSEKQPTNALKHIAKAHKIQQLNPACPQRQHLELLLECFNEQRKPQQSHLAQDIDRLTKLATLRLAYIYKKAFKLSCSGLMRQSKKQFEFTNNTYEIRNQFAQIRKLPDNQEKLLQLRQILRDIHKESIKKIKVR